MIAAVCPDGKLEVGGAMSSWGTGGRCRFTTREASRKSAVSPATATARNTGRRGPRPRQASRRHPTAVRTMTVTVAPTALRSG